MLCFPKASKDFRVFFFCIPLAPTTLILNSAFVGWSAYEIYGAVKSDDLLTIDVICTLLVSSTKLLFGIAGFVAVLSRWAAAMNLLVIGVKPVIIAALARFILSWIEWVIAFNGTPKWQPSIDEQKEIMQFTFLHLLFFSSSWWIVSVLRSLKYVLKYRGTGWGYDNQSELRAVLETRQMITAITCNAEEMPDTTLPASLVQDLEKNEKNTTAASPSTASTIPH